MKRGGSREAPAPFVYCATFRISTTRPVNTTYMRGFESRSGKFSYGEAMFWDSLWNSLASPCRTLPDNSIPRCSPSYSVVRTDQCLVTVG